MMTVVLMRVLVDTVMVGIVLFAAAGTLAWQRAWILLGVLLSVRTLTAIMVFRVNPVLLRERATVLVHGNQPWADRIVLLAFMATAFVGVPAAAARDVFRWHVLPSPSPSVAAVGLVLFALGWMIKALALRENAFAVTVVRLQPERQHTAVDTGVYRVVRHPMYSGNPFVNTGLSLWLGSYTAVIFALVPLGLLMIRVALEERFLERELPGYSKYVQRVRYRLLPGVW